MSPLTYGFLSFCWGLVALVAVLASVGFGMEASQLSAKETRLQLGSEWELRTRRNHDIHVTVVSMGEGQIEYRYMNSQGPFGEPESEDKYRFMRVYTPITKGQQ